MEIPAALSPDHQKPHISVWLSDKYDKEQKFFRCPVCGHVVFGYYSSAKIVMPGEGQFFKSPITIQCNGAITVQKDGREITTRCKTIFFIA